MTVFSPQPLKKLFFLYFFRQSDPPPQEVSKCKNSQFFQWILKDDDVYFEKISACYIWGNSFVVKNKGFLHNMLPSPYGVTRPQWVKISSMIRIRHAEMPYCWNTGIARSWVSQSDFRFETQDIGISDHKLLPWIDTWNVKSNIWFWT